jgi:hypothetical protein
MFYHDDASTGAVVQEMASAIREAARTIGKADRSVRDADIQELQLAMTELEDALSFKRRSNAGSSQSAQAPY